MQAFEVALVGSSEGMLRSSACTSVMASCTADGEKSSRIRGPKGGHLRFIMKATGAKLWHQQKPARLHVAACCPESLAQAVHMAKDFVATVERGFFAELGSSSASTPAERPTPPDPL